MQQAQLLEVQLKELEEGVVEHLQVQVPQEVLVVEVMELAQEIQLVLVEMEQLTPGVEVEVHLLQEELVVAVDQV